MPAELEPDGLPADSQLVAAGLLHVVGLPLPLGHLVDREVRVVAEQCAELGGDTEVLDREPGHGRAVVLARETETPDEHLSARPREAKAPRPCTPLPTASPCRASSLERLIQPPSPAPRPTA